jgi:hypothetical protein
VFLAAPRTTRGCQQNKKLAGDRVFRRGYRWDTQLLAQLLFFLRLPQHPHNFSLRAGGIVPGDGIFTTWSYRAGAGRAEAFLLNPQPLTARTAREWGVVAEVVPNGKALSRARELAALYLKVPEVTRRNTRVHFIHPLKERIVREVGYGLSLEGASAADLVTAMQANTERAPSKEQVA